MKKMTLFICLGLAFGTAYADEFSDAQKSWDNKDYTRAFQGFTKLANAGNAAAQLQLGEMYGYGEGTAEDATQASYWLKKSITGGNTDAAAALAIHQERSERKADIARYTVSFDGGVNKYNCPHPAIPEVSMTNASISEVTANVNVWTECYNRFVANLNSSMPISKTIPADILKLMSAEEFDRATKLISKTHEEMALKAEKDAEIIAAENIKWKEKTEQYVKGANDEATMRQTVLERNNALDARNRANILSNKSIGRGR